MWRKVLVAIAFWAWGIEDLSSEVRLFAWDLADWGPENLVLRFEPRVETTLAAYNTAMAHAKYGIVGLKFGEFVLNMAGFKELTPAELSRYKTETEAIIGAQNGILTLNGIVLWEWMSHSIALGFEQLHSFLLSLAEAIDTKNFEHTYNTLLPQGLEKLEEYFLEHCF